MRLFGGRACLSSEHAVVEAVRPEAPECRQLDLTVEQEVDPLQPYRDPGVSSAVLPHLGQGAAEILQIAPREPAHERGGREQRFVEDQ